MAKEHKGGAVRKSTKVGPDYAEGRYEVPWNAEIGGSYGSKKGKTIDSPAGTTFEPPFSIHHGYGELWEGK